MKRLITLRLNLREQRGHKTKRQHTENVHFAAITDATQLQKVVMEFAAIVCLVLCVTLSKPTQFNLVLLLLLLISCIETV